jgi:hypothetical protein
MPNVPPAATDPRNSRSPKRPMACLLPVLMLTEVMEKQSWFLIGFSNKLI